MFKPMFSKSHAPITVGSLLRNTSCGNRIYIVTELVGDVVTFQTYGNTNKGNFKPAQRHKVGTGKVGGCPAAFCKSTNCSVWVKGGTVDWQYTHVVRN